MLCRSTQNCAFRDNNIICILLYILTYFYPFVNNIFRQKTTNESSNRTFYAHIANKAYFK